MKCSNCKNEFEGKFCPECGAKAEIAYLSPEPESEAENKSFSKKSSARSEKAKKPFFRRWWFILLIIILVCVIATSLKGRGEKLVWSDIVLSEMLPQPPADRGRIDYNYDDQLSLEVKKVSSKEFSEYIAACKEMGFTREQEASSSSFDAFNAEGYSLSLYYDSSDSELNISLNAPMEMGSVSWPSGEAGKQVPRPKSTVGKFSYEYNDSFFVYIGDTTKSDYNDYVSLCLEEGFDVDYDKGDTYYSAENSDGWEISVRYLGNNVMTIDVDFFGEEEEAGTGTVTTTAQPETTTEKETERETEKPEEADSSDIDPDFKAAMDGYRDFINDYVDFMNKYKSNPNDLGLLADYAAYMKDYSDFLESFEAWEEDEMNSAELAYYIDVQADVSKKMLEIAE